MRQDTHRTKKKNVWNRCLYVCMWRKKVHFVVSAHIDERLVNNSSSKNNNKYPSHSHMINVFVSRAFGTQIQTQQLQWIERKKVSKHCMYIRKQESDEQHSTQRSKTQMMICLNTYIQNAHCCQHHCQYSMRTKNENKNKIKKNTLHWVKAELYTHTYSQMHTQMTRHTRTLKH